MKTSPNTRPTSKVKRARRILLASLVALTSTGCVSGTGSWFNKDATQPSSPGLTSTLSNTGKGIAGQFKSMGTAVSSAMGKARSAVTSKFSNEQPTGDATSLANMPDSLGPEIFVANGHLYESQSNFARALDNYTKALEIEPNNEPALLSTARLYTRQQQHDQAAEFYSKALAVTPKADTFNELALAQQKQGKMAEAQASLKQAITADPKNVRYRNNLASMLVSVGRSDEAVQELQQVFPPAVANYNVAYLHFSNQNVPAAQQHLQVALSADPNLKEARQLMDRIGGSSAGQTAMAAYQSAKNLYHTAQTTTAATNPTGTPMAQGTRGVPAATVGHQVPSTQGLPPVVPSGQIPAGQVPSATTGAYPTYPTTGYPGVASPTGAALAPTR